MLIKWLDIIKKLTSSGVNRKASSWTVWCTRLPMVVTLLRVPDTRGKTMSLTEAPIPAISRPGNPWLPLHIVKLIAEHPVETIIS